MKRKRIVNSFLFTMILATAGCGNQMFPEEVTESHVNTISENAAANLSQTQIVINELENKLTSSGLSVEEYKTLANAYQKENMIKKERDLLEQCVRLTGDGETFSQLQDVIVNVKEENDELQNELNRLNDYMGTDDYFGEAVAILMTNEWEELMMPKMKQGKRSYYLENEELGMKVYVEVGYLDDGTFYTNAWRVTSDSKISYFSQAGPDVKMYTCGYENDNLEGAFIQWVCDREIGSVTKTEGTYHEGICIGDYKSSIHTGTGNVDLFALWSSKDQLTYEEYTGTFDENGYPSVEQPSDSELAGESPLLAYAFNANRTKYLFISFNEESEKEQFTFKSNALGMSNMPSYTAYEPQTDTAKEDTTQIRIYDSNIEWFNGTNWVVIGSVDSISRQDPFNQYDDGEVEVDTEKVEKKEEVGGFASNPSVGEVENSAPSTQKPSTQKPSTQKPSTQKPSTQKPQTQTPSTPQTPVTPEPSTPQPSTPQPSTPEPSQPSQPSTPEPSQPSTPDPPAPTPPTPSVGEGEAEWGEDIL